VEKYAELANIDVWKRRHVMGMEFGMGSAI